MGGRGAGSSTGGRTQTQQQTVVSAQWNQQAQTQIQRISAGQRFQSVSFTDPSNGHIIRASIDYVRPRVRGTPSYTVRVDDVSSGDRLFYTYGVQTIAQVRDDIRRYSHVSAQQATRQQRQVRLTFQSVGNGNWQGHTPGVGGGQVLDETGSSRDPNNGRSGRLYSARAWDSNYNSVGSTTYHSSLNEAKRAIQNALARQRNT